MGEGAGEFKTTGIVNDAGGQAQARIADAAAVIVHRLIGSLATEADCGGSTFSRLAFRDDDFDLVLRRDAFEKH